MYGDRINQFDVRVAKTLKYGRSRTLIALDLYNVLNSSAVLTYNNIFVPGGPWLQPLTILTPRFLKLTAEIESVMPVTPRLLPPRGFATKAVADRHRRPGIGSGRFRLGPGRAQAGPRSLLDQAGFRVLHHR